MRKASVFSKTALFIFILLEIGFLTRFAGQSRASVKEDVKKGNLLYNNGRYREAVKSYEESLSKRPDLQIVNFNAGCALYKEGSFYKATELFNKAIASGNDKVIAEADYNIGNATYRIGNSRETNDLKRAKELYETALQYYKRAMDLDPPDMDAKFNYEFVQQRLNALKEKKEEDKEEKKKEDKKEDQSKGGGGGKDKEESEKEEDKDRGDSPKAEQQKPAGQTQPDEQKKEQHKEEDKEKTPGGQTDASAEKGKGEREKSEAQKGSGQKMERSKDEGKRREEKGGLAAYQSPQSQEETGEMSEQEARMLLDGYRGEEATGRTIRMRQKPVTEPEPEKDW